MAELARAIAQERVAFTDGGGDGGIVERATYTRLERLLRVMWTMALDGELPAIRCLLEYMEGKPVQLVAATITKEDGRSATADELAQELSKAAEKFESWCRELEAIAARGGWPPSSERSG